VKMLTGAEIDLFFHGQWILQLITKPDLLEQ
jgi:hypothetical protein